MTAREHSYTARLVWEGNRGDGTTSYTGYGRDHRVEITGKPAIAGSSDPAFRGDAARHNPEDLFIASVAACHMLFYLSLCARQGVRVLRYTDEARGTMELKSGGGGRFASIELYPEVTIATGDDDALARRLHDDAHRLCFIANSCSVPIEHHPTITTAVPA